MTTTELIKMLSENETGAISNKPRVISIYVNGRFLPNPEIIVSGTGDGIVGPEICLDITGEEWGKEEE